MTVTNSAMQNNKEFIQAIKNTVTFKVRSITITTT